MMAQLAMKVSPDDRLLANVFEPDDERLAEYCEHRFDYHVYIQERLREELREDLIPSRAASA